jgi:hypothetical protein
MPTVQQRILNEEPDVTSEALGVAQASVFATVFAALKPIVANGVSTFLFPALTLTTLYKNYREWKKYKREVNKNLGKKSSLALTILTTVAEVVAVTISTVVVSAVVPAIFLAISCVNFLSHFGKTLYHGYKWFRAESGSKKCERHKAEFISNAVGATITGVMGAAMGILMFAPAFNLVTWGATVGVAAQTTAATFLGTNAIVGGYSVYNIRKEQAKAKKLKEHTFIQNRRSEGPAFEVVLENKHDFPEKRTGFTHKQEKYKIKYERKGKFESLTHDDLGDLNRKLEVSSQPKTLLLQFIQQEINSLVKDLDPSWIKNGSKNIKLQNGKLPHIEFRSTFMVFQREKRLCKLQAVCLLKELVEKGETSLKDEFDNTVRNIPQILDYFDRINKTEDVFKSSFRTVGRMQKLFVLVEENYLLCKTQNQEVLPNRHFAAAAA